MPTFPENESVLFKRGTQWHRGRVTAVVGRSRRVVTPSGKRHTVAVGDLRPARDRVLILETRLDRNLKKSKRIYGPMMQQWLQAMNVDVLYERVHTLDDLRQFLRVEGKNVATRVIHFMGHGRKDLGKGNVSLLLTFGKINLGDPEHLEIFRGLKDKILLFSCCEAGADPQAMEAVRNASGAAAVIAYRKEIYDWYTNLAEGMLYERLMHSRLKPKTIVKRVIAAMEQLGIRLEGMDAVARKPVLVCF